MIRIWLAPCLWCLLAPGALGEPWEPVRLAEFAAFQRAFTGSDCVPHISTYDRDGDGCVGLYDLAILSAPPAPRMHALTIGPVDRDGRLTPGVTVRWLSSNGHAARAVTDSAGVARFERLPNAKGTIVVLTEDLDSSAIPVALPPTQNEVALVVRPGSPSARVENVTIDMLEQLPVASRGGTQPAGVGPPVTADVPVRRSPDDTSRPQLDGIRDEFCDGSLFHNGTVDAQSTAVSAWRAEDDSFSRWAVDDVTLALDATITALDWLGNEPLRFNWSGQAADYIVLRAGGVGGSPGSLVIEGRGVAAVRLNTGGTLFGDPIWQYTIGGLQLSLEAGGYWVGVRPVQNLPLGGGPNDSGWWITSSANASSGVYVDYGPSAPDWDSGEDPNVFGERLQMAFCLFGFDGWSPYGACCDELTGVCEDCVQGFCHAPDRFSPGTTCADMEPACGLATGACCDLQIGGCIERTLADCNAIQGDYAGNFTTCDSITCPCVVNCPSGSTNEGEPPCHDDYVDQFNAGCAEGPPLTYSITACGQTICGGSGTFTGLRSCTTNEDCPTDETCDNEICTGGAYRQRDTDWYAIELATPTRVTWTVEAEFEVQIGIMESNGETDCTEPPTFLTSAIGDACQPTTVSACLGPGTWYLYVAPLHTSGVPCDATYVATAECGSCPAGACCLSDGTCNDLIEPACEETGGVVWRGPDTTCDTDICPQPPTNDTCDTAAPVDLDTPTTGNNVLASDTPNCGAGSPARGVWYAVTGTGGTMTASTCLAGTEFDTSIEILCDCDPAVCIASNDDAAGAPVECLLDGVNRKSLVSWCSQAGLSYLIHVGGSGANAGSFELIVTDDGGACDTAADCVPPTGACCVDQSCLGVMARDDCDSLGGEWFEDRTCDGLICPAPLAETCPQATVIVTVPFATTIDNDAAAPSPPPGGCNTVDAVEMQNDAWFAYTATGDCTLTVTVDPDAGVGYDAIVSVHGGTGCDDLEELACGDEPEPVRVVVEAFAGETYWIQVGDWGLFEGGGTTTVSVDCAFATGACCDEVGVCTELGQLACADAGGSFLGGGSICDPNPCPQIPTNDECTSATPLSIPGSVLDDNTLALYDPESQPACGTESVNQAMWYEIVGTGRELAVSTCTPETDFDTKLQVWCNDCAQPVCVGGNDDALNAPAACSLDGLNRKSSFSFCSEAGVTYFVAVGGFDTAVGRFELRVMEGESCDAPPNCSPQYCASGATYEGDSLCAEVSINALSNDTGGQCAAYSDFTALSTEVVQGNSYALAVTMDTCGVCFGMWAKVFVDWNQDLDFDDFGEQSSSSTEGSVACPHTLHDTLVVPVDALEGPTRMRVVVREGGSSQTTSACGLYGWGETEDYTLVVVAAGPRGEGSFEDDDEDGVPNLCDNCLDLSNPNQRDDDDDGVGNLCDNCPIHANGPNAGPNDQLDTDGDGVGDECDPCPLDNPDDSDGDNVCDSNDRCPGYPDDLDADLDGMPDACDLCTADTGPTGNDLAPGARDDDDGDGVLNCNDVCLGADDAIFGDCSGAIPTTGTWGLIVLSLLLLAAGKVLFGRVPPLPS